MLGWLRRHRGGDRPEEADLEPRVGDPESTVAVRLNKDWADFTEAEKNELLDAVPRRVYDLGPDEPINGTETGHA